MTEGTKSGTFDAFCNVTRTPCSLQVIQILLDIQLQNYFGLSLIKFSFFWLLSIAFYYFQLRVYSINSKYIRLASSYFRLLSNISKLHLILSIYIQLPIIFKNKCNYRLYIKNLISDTVVGFKKINKKNKHILWK